MRRKPLTQTERAYREIAAEIAASPRVTQAQIRREWSVPSPDTFTGFRTEFEPVVTLEFGGRESARTGALSWIHSHAGDLVGTNQRFSYRLY